MKLSVIQYIKIICNALQIDMPKINKVQSLSTSTMMAAYDGKNDILFYKNIDSVEVYFYIAHELRHKWQFKYHPEWFEDYKPSTESDVLSYNLQKVELDANGFAIIAYSNLLGLKPTFDGVDEIITKAIYNRADEIVKEIRGEDNG